MNTPARLLEGLPGATFKRREERTKLVGEGESKPSSNERACTHKLRSFLSPLEGGTREQYAVNARGSLGFSLIELVAAMSIFSIGVMACVELYSISLRSTIDTQDYTQAVFLAQAVMEETLADGYLSATTDSDDFGEEHPRHSWELEITDTDQEGLMQVRVVVKWNARNGGEKQYELTTLHADRDVTATPDETEAPL